MPPPMAGIGMPANGPAPAPGCTKPPPSSACGRAAREGTAGCGAAHSAQHLGGTGVCCLSSAPALALQARPPHPTTSTATAPPHLQHRVHERVATHPRPAKAAPKAGRQGATGGCHNANIAHAAWQCERAGRVSAATGGRARSSWARLRRGVGCRAAGRSVGAGAIKAPGSTVNRTAWLAICNPWALPDLRHLLHESAAAVGADALVLRHAELRLACNAAGTGRQGFDRRTPAQPTLTTRVPLVAGSCPGHATPYSQLWQ